MADIIVLDDKTINQIAAGEVVERPVSVVKELVENACDSGATNISVEIKDGGISMIRVTDNGSGITRDNIKTAFLRHATSKIKSIDDLLSIRSLGFRGEALSSIASVAQVELLTKCRGELFGYRYVIEGGREKSLDEAGIPEGTTMIVRNLFYNTPARRKFLKSATTEGGYITELMERMVLSHPSIGFKYIINGREKIISSGNGDTKENIYQLFGRDMATNCIRLDYECEFFKISGFAGKPESARGNRNYELFFVNSRLVKNMILSKAVEEAYRSFLMLHKYPFVLLFLEIDSKDIDVNVHPAKTEIKFYNEEILYKEIVKLISEALSQKEMIPKVKAEEVKANNIQPANSLPSHISSISDIDKNIDETIGKNPDNENINEKTIITALDEKALDEDVLDEEALDEEVVIKETAGENNKEVIEDADYPDVNSKINKENNPLVLSPEPFESGRLEVFKQEARKNFQDEIKDIEQESLFDKDFLSEENIKKHKIVGQVFDTYWIVEMDNNMYIIDQHAAHEKVLYERIKKRISNNEVFSQSLSPAIIVSLSTAEIDVLKRYIHNFRQLGFEIEEFGGHEYAITSVPVDLFGLSERDYFTLIIDDLIENNRLSDPEAINDRIASMACKAAIKGNMSFSLQEAKALIDELLKLDNPYNCPHGRPTIISYSKSEIEKLFKRIV